MIWTFTPVLIRLNISECLKIKSFTFCRSIHLSDWAKDEPQGSKRDIADLIMEERKPLDKPTTIGDILRWNQELGFPKERFTINI